VWSAFARQVSAAGTDTSHVPVRGVCAGAGCIKHKGSSCVRSASPRRQTVAQRHVSPDPISILALCEALMGTRLARHEEGARAACAWMGCARRCVARDMPVACMIAGPVRDAIAAWTGVGKEQRKDSDWPSNTSIA